MSGHGRLQAALLLQVEKVPVDEQDFVTEADEWAHLVADNRIAELAETDGAMLKDILGDLDTGAFDMDVTGFDNAELERVINSFRSDAPSVGKTGNEHLMEYLNRDTRQVNRAASRKQIPISNWQSHETDACQGSSRAQNQRH